MAKALAVEGQLSLAWQNHTCWLQARGDKITLEIPSGPRLRELAHPLGRRSSRRRFLHQLFRSLKHADLQISIHRNHRELAVCGSGIKPSLLSRLLALPGWRVHWGVALKEWWVGISDLRA